MVHSSICYQFKCLQTLQRRYVKHPSAHTLSRIRTLEVQLHNNIVNTKEVYECQLISDLVGRTSSSSSIYNYLKKLKKDESLPTVMYLESDSADINTAKAEIFNQFFSQFSYIMRMPI